MHTCAESIFLECNKHDGLLDNPVVQKRLIKSVSLGRGCGSVGRAVALETRGHIRHQMYGVRIQSLVTFIELLHIGFKHNIDHWLCHFLMADSCQTDTIPTNRV